MPLQRSVQHEQQTKCSLTGPHTHRCFWGPQWPCTPPPPPRRRKQWYGQESTTQPTTCWSVKRLAWNSPSKMLLKYQRSKLDPVRVLGNGWYFGIVVCARALKQCELGAVVGSCCQGRWCVIFSPLCLLPVGQGLLERGVADFTE